MPDPLLLPGLVLGRIVIVVIIVSAASVQAV
jgi:hypothetical protein